MNIKVGDTLVIHCYKHNGMIHKSWKLAYVLDIKKDYIVLGNENVLVTKQDGRTWHTKEPAIMFFYKKRWFNIIAQLKPNGIFYYCNIASPYIIDDGIIKYIDYDLDLRIFPTGEYKILDRLEYKRHQKLMGYSKELSRVIEDALEELIALYNNGANFFGADDNRKYYDLYHELKMEEKSN